MQIAPTMNGTLPPCDGVKREALTVHDLIVEFTQDNGLPRRVLDGISIDIPRGQFLAIVGRSGGGKTTLLNAITGLLQPTSGSIEVLGKAPSRARSEIGFIPARDALLPWRSAKRNVEYGLELRGVKRRARSNLARHYLELVGLEDAVERWPWQLSQGMRQRVSLARAWALEPRLLLMDEPFAALDAQTRESVRGQFLKLLAVGESPTVILVTHDLEEAVILADRIVVLGGGGRIIADVKVPASAGHDADGMLASPDSIAVLRKLRLLLREDAAVIDAVDH